jgi:uncharacterized membrane protein
MTYLFLKWLHIVSATVMFGTGAGIAFFMWRAHRSRDAALIAGVARAVVLADVLFTASAVVIQPVTGLLLMHVTGYPFTLFWIRASVILYVLAGCCWLPVVWLQVQMRNIAIAAARQSGPLPEIYFKYFRYWFWLGWPGFGSVLAILWLMTAKPA